MCCNFILLFVYFQRATKISILTLHKKYNILLIQVIYTNNYLL